MGNFLDLQNKIAFDLRGVNTAAETGFLDQIKSTINQVIDSLSGKMFWFNCRVSYTSTNPNQPLAEYYSLPVDYKALICDPALVDPTDNSRVVLSRVTNNDIDLMNGRKNKDKPKFYTIISDQLRLAAVPNRVYTILINYIMKIPPLVNDTDTNVWLSEAEDLIRFRSDQRLAILPLRNSRLASELSPFINEAMNVLNEKTLNWLAIEEIIPNDF